MGDAAFPTAGGGVERNDDWGAASGFDVLTRALLPLIVPTAAKFLKWNIGGTARIQQGTSEIPNKSRRPVSVEVAGTNGIYNVPPIFERKRK